MVVYTKNATLFGALVHQTLFQGQVTSLGPLNAFIVRGKTKLNIAIWPPTHAIRALSTWDIGLWSIKQWIQQLHFPIIKILNKPNVPWSWPTFWLSKSELTEASSSAAVEYSFGYIHFKVWWLIMPKSHMINILPLHIAHSLFWAVVVVFSYHYEILDLNIPWALWA